MPWMLLLHPGLLICLVLVSIAWPLGIVPAAVCAVVLVLAYAYLVLVPLRSSRFTRQRRRMATTVGLLVSLVVTGRVLVAHLAVQQRDVDA